ncbi:MULTISPECIES: MFS transporter [Clostridium]|uniref:L-galactonate transporter n=1 Tax=Clostridium ragsdalei P11 TaxID=1353534 RepID=A0A1A6AXB1_9CLOT|nr:MULTISPECIES: MFS transporter [Clostridium]OBR94687.1 L-galactonate transporter [Clostridium ragsdalei P11]QXE20597.1 MFS transporter [Clostridium sp. 001]
MKQEENMSNTQSMDNSKSKLNIRWAFVILLLIGAIVNYLDRANLSVANTTIAREFHLSSTQMGLLLSAFLWPYAIANLPSGWLVDKFGPKKMFSFASGFWSTATIICSFISSYPLFYLMRMILGVAESPFFTAGLKVNQRWFSDEERGLPVAIINTGSQISNAIAPPILTLLLVAFGWRSMFVIIGVLGILVLLVWQKLYRDPTSEETIAIKGSLEAAQEVRKSGKQASWGELFKHRNTWFMIIGNFGIMFTIWVYLTWLPSYLQKERGFSLTQSGFIASLPYICGIIGVLLGGTISDYLIKKGVQAITSRKFPIVGGALIAAISTAPLPFIKSTSVIIVLLCVGYFASQLPSGVIWTLAADVAPSNQVASLGAIQNFGGFLGAAIAPIATGIILDKTGTIGGVFLIGAGLLILGAISYGIFLKPVNRGGAN